MAAPELGMYFNAMSRDMGSKLSGYYASLQHRFGDPRVYAMQQSEMRQQNEHIAQSKKEYTASLLEEAYQKQQVRNRNNHKKRLSTRQVGRNVASRPKSGAEVSTQPQISQPQQRRSLASE